MFYLTIVDALNWMNAFLLVIIFGFLTYWYLRVWKKKKTVLISKIFLIINCAISAICFFFLIWSWLTFYLLEDIYHITIEKEQAIKLEISFCLVSVVLNILFIIYLFVFSPNFWLVEESKKTLILGFWKIELANLSIQKRHIYFKTRRMIRLLDQPSQKLIKQKISKPVKKAD